MKTHIYLLILLLLLFACGEVEFSPNQKFDSNTPTDLNKKNIEKLYSQEKDDTIRFVLTGDTQRAYSACEDMVSVINSIKGVDFALLNGDISDFGLYQEMEWINDIYSDLNMPYIAVLGNHDISANGKSVFRRMYGNENFSFIYDGVKFVCFDSNSREYNYDGTIPNISWLKAEMAAEAGVNNYIAVSHVPSFSDDFDSELEKPYASILTENSKCLGSLHAHINQTEVLYPYNKTTPFIVANTAAKREFYLIEIVNGKLLHKVIKF
ncbi:metallophosphoesterase family protein [Desertivirga arenae]|uniref:metallophosphoesterase family protein n=1 Tax=Desertivirga arenae TaxID=2810309 RepID=UPI001A9687A3|nr:metallophosphoesterase [Pedobacter sp. SYSU D00823]